MTGRKPSFAVSLLPPAPPPVCGGEVDVDTPSSARCFRCNDPFQDHSIGDVLQHPEARLGGAGSRRHRLTGREARSAYHFTELRYRE